MKIVRWSYNNLHVPMIRDDKGGLWCTNKALSEALGVTEQALRMVYRRRGDKLKGLSLTDCDAKDFITSNKVELGIGRLRKDMLLWSESEMIRIALWSKSSVSDVFVEEVVKLVREQATTGYVTQDEHNRVLIQLGQTAARLDNIERIVGLRAGAHVKLSVLNGGLA